jgi:hypothetical protein
MIYYDCAVCTPSNRTGNVPVPFMPSPLPERGFTFYERSIAMWNKPTTRELSKLPRLHQTAHIPGREKIIHLHFFFGGCDWYIAEYDGEDLFFGFAILHDDLVNAEWGYISFSELADISVCGMEIDRDVYWAPVPAGSIARIGGLI